MNENQKNRLWIEWLESEPVKTCQLADDVSDWWLSKMDDFKSQILEIGESLKKRRHKDDDGLSDFISKIKNI